MLTAPLRSGRAGRPLRWSNAPRTSAAVTARRRLRTLRPVDPGADRVAEWITDLALPIDPARAARVAPGAAGAVLVLVATVTGAAGAAVVVAGAAVTVFALRRSAPGRRAAATERALPGVLDAVARHLRAGGSLAQAIAAARPPRTAPDLAASWARLTELIPLVGVAAALDGWSAASGPTTPTTGAAPARRRPTSTSTASRSIQLAAAALTLAASTGGSPARAIDGVAATLRSRLAVAEEIRALSAQARASAAVIALAPLVFGVIAGLGDPRTRDFLASPAGLALLIAGLGLDGLGAWWMAHLCRPVP